MKQETLKHFADGATISAVSTGVVNKLGFLHYLNVNAAGIGVLLTAFFGLIGLVFYYLTWKKSTQADQNKKDLSSLECAFSEHKTETNNQFMHVNSGIDEIKELVKKVVK